jgi:hypothetical protein
MTEDAVFIARVREILDRVQFENYAWEVRTAHGGVVVYGVYMEADVYEPTRIERQQTRKWLVSPLMTDSEIVQTIFKLCATSMEHRLREHFSYRGARVFGPHFDIEDLVSLCRTRENAGGRG